MKRRKKFGENRKGLICVGMMDEISYLRRSDFLYKTVRRKGWRGAKNFSRQHLYNRKIGKIS